MGLIARIATVCLAVAAGSWALLHFAWRPHQCNAAISELTARTAAAEQTADGYQRLLRARTNLRELAALREICPTAVRVPMLVGANQEITGQVEEAERSYRSALAIDQRPEIYQAIARVALVQGRVDDAVSAYVTAVRFAPLVIEEIMSPDLKDRVAREVRQAETAAREK